MDANVVEYLEVNQDTTTPTLYGVEKQKAAFSLKDFFKSLLGN